MPDGAHTFGQLLRWYRVQRDLSQRELAVQAGVHDRLIQKYERDITAPGLETFARIVKALEIPADYLLPTEFAADGRRERSTTNA